MGLAPGGLMRQQLYEDEYGYDAWDRTQSSRCFVHILNSRQWNAATDKAMPAKPPSSARYVNAGLPWFDYYDEAPAVEGSAILRGLASVLHLGRKKQETPIPENESVSGEHVVVIKKPRSSDEVRQGTF